MGWDDHGEFQRLSKDKVTYQHTQHTTSEARYLPYISSNSINVSHHDGLPRAEFICWIAESKQPFQILKDHRFQSLMKTGRPAYHILHPNTVSRDVKAVFVKVRQRIAKMLQVRYEFPNLA